MGDMNPFFKWYLDMEKYMFGFWVCRGQCIVQWNDRETYVYLEFTLYSYWTCTTSCINIHVPGHKRACGAHTILVSFDFTPVIVMYWSLNLEDGACFQAYYVLQIGQFHNPSYILWHIIVSYTPVIRVDDPKPSTKSRVLLTLNKMQLI